MKRKMQNCVMTCLLLLLGGVSVNAQNWRNAPQYHFGVRAGFSLTNSLDNSWWDDGCDSKDLAGPMLGIAFDTKISKLPFYVETGLYYMNRGVKYEFEQIGQYNTYNVDYTDNNHSLLVPALISYHAYINKNMSFQPFMGPYVAYGFGDEELDCGWRLGCGFNSKQLYVNMGVDLGIKDDFENHEGYISSFFMTVGWNFLGKR